jgi:hypothetical protein
MRGLTRALVSVRHHDANDLTGVPNAVVLERRRGRVAVRARGRGKTAADIVVRQDVDHPGNGMGVLNIDGIYPPPGDGARH